MDFRNIPAEAWARTAQMLQRVDLWADDDTTDTLRDELRDANLTYTRDTLEGFAQSASEHWHSVDEKIEGDGWAVYEGVKVAKHFPPRSLGVVDAGDFRFVLEL